MRLILLLAFLGAGLSAQAQVYRWVDEKGAVHYSNSTPPAGAKAKVIEVDTKPGPPSADSQECYTVRCQGERLEQRLARREEAEARDYAARIAAAPKPARGLSFSQYTSIYRGMTEGEFVGVAGAPDFLFHDGFVARRYTYMPTLANPFTSTITVVNGRVLSLERARKF